MRYVTIYVPPRDKKILEDAKKEANDKSISLWELLKTAYLESKK